LVYDEAKRGDTKAAQERLEILKSLPLLQADAASKKLPRKFVKQGAIPETEKADALHIAIATTFGMDYLVTWNLRHIKNRVKRVEIDAICRHEGYEPPTFYSPRELLEIKHVEPNPG
jgi:hypothetical protein